MYIFTTILHASVLKSAMQQAFVNLLLCITIENSSIYFSMILELAAYLCGDVYAQYFKVRPAAILRLRHWLSL